MRISICRILAAALPLVIGLSATNAHALYPERPVRVIVPFPTGSASDNIGRLAMQELGAAMSGNFFVDNRAGASGLIGMELGTTAKPDGYTLVVGSSSTHSVNPSIFKKLPYDPVAGATNITCLAILPQVIVVSEDAPFNSLKQLVEYGKANPAKLSYAYGTPSAQVASAAFTAIGGFKAEPIPYKGPADGILAVMRGETQFMVVDLATAIGQIKGKKLRALGISSATGSPLLPGVPSFQAAGFGDYNMVIWVGLSAPAAVPRDITKRLVKGIEAVMQKSTVAKQYADWGIEGCAQEQAVFEKFVVDQQGIWRAKIQEVGIPLQ